MVKKKKNKKQKKEKTTRHTTSSRTLKNTVVPNNSAQRCFNTKRCPMQYCFLSMQDVELLL